MHSIAIFGGTFDPVHKGHIQTSLAIQAHFNFDEYLFLPCKIPALKPAASATNQQRINMLVLALQSYPQFKIDLREIHRDSPSYMVDTLSSFRAEYEQSSITLILGLDAFLSLPFWHEWKKLISLANFLIINRPALINQLMEDSLNELLLKQETPFKDKILTEKAGVIYQFDAGHFEISSTQIRKTLYLNQGTKNMLPEAVYLYIKQQGLYQ